MPHQNHKDLNSRGRNWLYCELSRDKPMSVLQRKPSHGLYTVNNIFTLSSGRSWPLSLKAGLWVTREQYPPKKGWSCFFLVYAGLAGHVTRSRPRLHAVFLVSFSTEKRGQRLPCDQTRHLVQVGGDPKSKQEFWIYTILFSVKNS